jgi:hypothetical protein
MGGEEYVRLGGILIKVYRYTFFHMLLLPFEFLTLVWLSRLPLTLLTPQHKQPTKLQEQQESADTTFMAM